MDQLLDDVRAMRDACGTVSMSSCAEVAAVAWSDRYLDGVGTHGFRVAGSHVRVAASTPGDVAGDTDGLVADLVGMSRRAAVDGLSLGLVFADVRLVLHLSSDALLPDDLLGRCAREWASASTLLDDDIE